MVTGASPSNPLYDTFGPFFFEASFGLFILSHFEMCNNYYTLFITHIVHILSHELESYFQNMISKRNAYIIPLYDSFSLSILPHFEMYNDYYTLIICILYRMN